MLKEEVHFVAFLHVPYNISRPGHLTRPGQPGHLQTGNKKLGTP